MSNNLDEKLGLIWVSTVCKGYQQTTPVGKKYHKDHKAYTFDYIIPFSNVMLRIFAPFAVIGPKNDTISYAYLILIG